jgi:hypothetical protein
LEAAGRQALVEEGQKLRDEAELLLELETDAAATVAQPGVEEKPKTPQTPYQFR